MPLEASDFPEDVQVAFFIYQLLTDRWDGMSGLYLGKDWSSCAFLLDLYEIDNPKEIVFYIKAIEHAAISKDIKDKEKQRKAQERKAKAASGGGKNFTHNVKG